MEDIPIQVLNLTEENDFKLAQIQLDLAKLTEAETKKYTIEIVRQLMIQRQIVRWALTKIASGQTKNTTRI